MTGFDVSPLETQAGRRWTGGGLMYDVEQAVTAQVGSSGGGFEIIVGDGHDSDNRNGFATLA